jgi:hypothetical protein
MSLVPISEYVRSSSTPIEEMKLLEVAAGTGRFHTFIKVGPGRSNFCSSSNSGSSKSSSSSSSSRVVERWEATEVFALATAKIMAAYLCCKKKGWPDGGVEQLIDF